MQVYHRPLNHIPHGAIFNRVSKAVLDCIGLALLLSVIGPKILQHYINQSDTKLKPVITLLPAFSQFLLVFTLSSQWLLCVFSFPPIG